MSARFFLDTNIFVYSFDETALGKSRRAKGLIREAIETQRGVVSYQVAQEFFNIALRQFVRPMSLAEAGQYLGTVFRPMVAVHSSTSLFLTAMELFHSDHFSWYDALILAAAITADCGILYSEDLQHGRRIRDLKIVNPFL